MAKVINVGDRKVEKTKKAASKTKKKIDWQKIKAKVHYGCKVVIFRVIEAVIVAMFISTACIFIGNVAIPSLAYDMSAGVSLTQGTNTYIAIASWIAPLLFYVLLITAATFCVFKRFLKWLHGKFTAIINKSESTEKETV